VYYKKRTNPGAVWGLTELVMDDTAHQDFPDIEMESTGLARVVWSGAVGAGANYQVRYKDRTFAGVWSAVTNLTADAYDHYPPTIARDLVGDVHVLWCAQHAGSPANWQLGYIKYSAGAWGAVSYLTVGVGEYWNPYAMGGYEGNVNAAVGFRVQYHANAAEDALFYGDYTDAPGPAGPTVGGGGAKGGPGSKAWVWNNYGNGD
jgi:opacity protein-like surface antigen